MRRIPLLAVALLALVGSLLAPAFAAAQDAASWTSPTYGFSVSWDPAHWEERPDGGIIASGPNQLDRLLLVSAVGSLYVEGARNYDGVAGNCVQGELDLLSQDPSVSSVRQRNDLAADGPGASIGGIEATISGADGQDPVRLVFYVECRSLSADSVAILTLITPRTAFPEALALAQPVADSMTGVPVPGLDDVGAPIDADTFAEWVAIGTDAAPVAGPAHGSLVPDPSAETAALAASGVSESDFVARLRWQNPSDGGAWDVGVAFRDQPDGSHYRLILDATGAWSFGIGVGEKIAEGDAPSMNLVPGAANGLEIVVSGGQAGFAVNGEFVSALDVAAITEPGDVWFGSGFSVETAADGATVNYRDFAVWSLAGLAPEAPGVLLPPLDGDTPDAPGDPTPEVPVVPALPDLPDFPLKPALDPPGDAPSADGPHTDDGAPRIVAVTVDPVADSGVSGLATLTDVDGAASVNLVLRGASGGELAVVHEGTCADLAPDPAFLLDDPDASGRSKTDLNVPRTDLLAGEFAIAVHAGADAFGEILACGDIG